MKTLVVLLVTTLVCNAGISVALPAARNVYSQDAQASSSRGIDLKVWKGYGLTINFIPTGEKIKQVWLGDPSRFALTSNGNLCQRSTSSNDESCGTGGATVLFVRQIKPINFPSLTTSPDGSTIITIITDSAEGDKHYQFQLTPASGKPSYTSLIIHPESEKPSPIGRQPILNTSRKTPQLVTTNPPVQQPKKYVTVKKPVIIAKPVTQQRTETRSNSLPPSSTNIANNSTTNPALPKLATERNSIPRNDANALAYGLTQAVTNKEIKPYSRTWRKLQDAIRLLRRGKSQQEAISLSGVPAELFENLINRGR